MFHLIIFVFTWFMLLPREGLKPGRWFIWDLVGEESSLCSESPRGARPLVHYQFSTSRPT